MLYWWTWCLLPLAGGIGAYGRWRTEAKLRSLIVPVPISQEPGILTRCRPGWPIMLINLLGSFAAGILAGLLPLPWLFVLGVGLLGGWTTFSTALLDIYQIATASMAGVEPGGRGKSWRDIHRDFWAALICAVLGLVACVSVALGGIWLGQFAL